MERTYLSPKRIVFNVVKIIHSAKLKYFDCYNIP
ncbi:hypothetical protein IMSAGC009_01966 [Lachnospiraceae bacterium]|nr:hypothetical protein IMSAGC009_01966 [Lachnospiraceae bacterium]